MHCVWGRNKAKLISVCKALGISGIAMQYLFPLWVKPFLTNHHGSIFRETAGLFIFCPNRLVYRWFLTIYQVTYVMGIAGYLILLLVFTGVGFLFTVNPDSIMELGVTLVFYGVYFGVMGRDCAELCVDYMAASMTVRVVCLSQYIHVCVLAGV